MKIKVTTLAGWGLIATIIASENFFYLVVGDSTRVMGVISLNDLFVLLAILWIGLIMFMYRNQPNPIYHFKWIILFSLVLMMTSSLQSYLLYGQDLIMGIRPQRYWLVWAFMYFPISKLLFLKRFTYEEVQKTIFIIGTLELIIYISQYLLLGQIQYLNVSSNDVYSTTRLYINNIFLNLLLFINLDRLFNKKKVIKSTLYIIAILFVIIIVGKMRMTFISVSGAIIIGFIMWRKGGLLKLLTFLMLFPSLSIILNLEEIQAIFLTLKGESTVNTLNIREVGREFYFSILKQHPVLGGGYINTQWEPAAIASRVYDRIFWVDNGIFGFAYFYGLLGVAWVIALFRKIYIMAWKVKRNLNCYLFFIMPLYWIIAMPTELHWYYNSFLVVTLLICMLEVKYRESC
ncbi:hypothetical protein ACIQXQ_14275 [Peribacillus sp. NPDC097198]|uniref:hypothetical protein n=1 Tax=Peribacillus sp. NPDC097198 TaxID=3364397 RepID=UPI00382CF330